MANIIGTIYLVDEPHIDVLKANLMNIPPPGGRVATGTMLCMDMDESDNMLELWFPDHCQKATLLCPPPIAMYKEIDGDMEGFVEEYNRYLDSEESVQEFLASMLLFLHIGGNILLYTPSHLEDDAVWLNTLVLYFYTRFGITIGGPNSQAAYDQSFDKIIPEFLYGHGVMDVFDFVSSSVEMPMDPFIRNKLAMELMPFSGPDQNPLDYYYFIKMKQSEGYPACQPAIIFN